jgi:N-glycosylase/DNA lyase
MERRWSDWQPLPGWTPAPPVFTETIDGGQSFRWTRGDDGCWTGLWGNCVAQLRQARDRIEWRAPTELHALVARELPRYLGGEHDWEAHVDALPWRTDTHLAACVQEFRGLRLLRQPLGETLLGFLCSATKQIVQIKQMIALIAVRHGAPIEPAAMRGREPDGADQAYRRLPTWAEIATIPEAELRACLLGFRARYIAETARFLASRPDWLNATEAAPYPVAKARLLELPGVGEKVADCILLFGAGRWEAFPVDTWILKALERRYGLTGWKPAQVAQFGRAHFGPLAGLAQQYLFAWERRHGGR